MSELAAIQRRFYALATGAASVDDATELLAGDPARIAIYRRMYRDRLVEAIAQDYPKLAALLGDEWHALAAEYLRDCPPSDPDIHHAGRRLAGFLVRRGRAWEADLARLEWARADVFFGADAAPLSRAELEGIDPASFPSLRLRMVPASAVVDVATNADDRWSAVEDGIAPPAPAVASRVVVVWRRGHMAVVHRTLDDDEVDLVRSLAVGTQFGHLCEALAQAPDPAARAAELLLRWLDAELLDGSAWRRL